MNAPSSRVGALGLETGTVAVPDDVDRLLDGIRAVLVDGHHLPMAVALAAAARSRDIPVIADAGSWKPGLEALLALVDVLVASADFRAPSGDGLEDLLALGPTWVARSAGAGPVAWSGADRVVGEVDPHAWSTSWTRSVPATYCTARSWRRWAVTASATYPPPSRARSTAATRSVSSEGARGWARPTR